MINPKHDAEELARTFAANKSIVIEDFFEPSYAEELYKFFTIDMDSTWWFTSFRGPAFGDPNDKTYKEGDVQSIQRTEANIEKINFETQKTYYSLSKGLFSYVFDRTTKHKDTCPCKECQFKKYFGSSTILDFFSTLTCKHLTEKGEFFCSRYSSGQFLGPHHDHNKGEIGFVINLTKNWKPEYGGLLQFLTDDYKHVTKTILPEFNKITLFEIPKEKGIPHLVSHVNPGVKLNRISYTGWFS